MSEIENNLVNKVTIFWLRSRNLLKGKPMVWAPIDEPKPSVTQLVNGYSLWTDKSLVAMGAHCDSGDRCRSVVGGVLCAGVTTGPTHLSAIITQSLKSQSK